MADYRAKNRNDKALGLARVRAAARPAPGIVRKDEIERQAWAAGLVQNEMGVWYPKQETSAGKKLDAAVDFSPTSALTDAASGVYNLLTQDRSAIESIGALPGVIGRSVMAPEKTDLQKKLWEQAKGNPYEYLKLLRGLTPAEETQNSIDTKIKSNEKDYNDMVSMLRDTGISEEEMYRDVVVGPDGQVNLNANVQGALSGIGYAADALRGTELIGYGLGKPVGLAARAATKAVIPRAVGVATNPRIINAGMQSVEAAARGARPGEVITTGVAALVAGNKPIANATRSRILPSGEKQVVDRVIEARDAENFVKNRPTPEASSPAYFGGVETRNLSPEALDERVSGAAEYISPEELANELSTLEGMGFATVDKTPASAKSAVSLTQKELADRTAAALSGIKKRERTVNTNRESRGQDPFEYKPHFDPYDLTKEELVTLWGSNPIYVYNAAGEIIPELGAHLGHGPGQSLKNGGSATLGTVRGQRGVSNMRYGSDF